jgi:serine/threonine-protein kinase
MTTVPTLVGLTRAEAESALDDAGLQLGQVRRQDDPDTDADVVVDASADAKDEVSEGTVVDLVIASGMVTVVDFTQQGYTLDDAQKALEELHLNVTVEDASCPADDPRTVKSQSRGPGEVPIHSDVILVSCSGAPDSGE